MLKSFIHINSFETITQHVHFFFLSSIIHCFFIKKTKIVRIVPLLFQAITDILNINKQTLIPPYCSHEKKEDVRKKFLSSQALFIWVHDVEVSYVGLFGSAGASVEGLKLEEVDKVLRRDRHEAAVRVVGCAGVATVLPEEDATVFAEVQSVAVLLLHGIMFPQGEVHQLPVHILTVA